MDTWSSLIGRDHTEVENLFSPLYDVGYTISIYRRKTYILTESCLKTYKRIQKHTLPSSVRDEITAVSRWYSLFRLGDHDRPLTQVRSLGHPVRVDTPTPAWPRGGRGWMQIGCPPRFVLWVIKGKFTITDLQMKTKQTTVSLMGYNIPTFSTTRLITIIIFELFSLSTVLTT